MQLMKIKQPGGNLKKRSAISDEVNSNESLVFSEYAKTINVGSLIRKTRKELGFSLQKVADRSGLSVSFVSQAERGILPPSVSSLKKIATALEIPAGMLMFNSGDNSGPTMVSVIRRNDRKKIVLPQSNAHYELITPDMRRRASMLSLTADAGAQSGPALSHYGEDCVVVLQGTLDIQVGDVWHKLKRGDSIYFNSEVPHRWQNSTKSKSIALWMSTPPSF